MYIFQANPTEMEAILAKSDVGSTVENRVVKPTQELGFQNDSVKLSTIGFAEFPVTETTEEDVHQDGDFTMAVYTCSCCDREFLDLADLKKHELEHSKVQKNNPNPVFSCTDCEQTFQSSELLQQHKTNDCIDLLLRPFFQCPHCDYAFKTNASLQKHQSIHEKRTHSCTECSGSFSKKSDLKKHQLQHSPSTFSCTQCRKAFKLESALLNHLNTHVKLKSHECDICSKEFAHASSLNAHSKIHQGIKSFVCTICQRSFSRGHHLTSHLTTHTHERKLSCEVCGKSFAHNSSLHSHMKTHNTEKESLSCEICKRNFFDSSTLKRHMKTHSEKDGKIHPCTICQRKFRQNYNLERHIQTHSVVKKLYSCDDCDKNFTQNSSLKDHRRKNHPTEEDLEWLRQRGETITNKKTKQRKKAEEQQTPHNKYTTQQLKKAEEQQTLDNKDKMSTSRKIPKSECKEMVKVERRRSRQGTHISFQYGTKCVTTSSEPPILTPAQIQTQVSNQLMLAQLGIKQQRIPNQTTASPGIHSDLTLNNKPSSTLAHINCPQAELHQHNAAIMDVSAVAPTISKAPIFCNHEAKKDMLCRTTSETSANSDTMIYDIAYTLNQNQSINSNPALSVHNVTEESMKFLQQMQRQQQQITVLNYSDVLTPQHKTYENADVIQSEQNEQPKVPVLDIASCASSNPQVFQVTSSMVKDSINIANVTLFLQPK